MVRQGYGSPYPAKDVKLVALIFLALILIKFVILVNGYKIQVYDLDEEEGEKEGEGKGAGWGIASLLYLALAIIILASIAPYIVRKLRRR